MKKFVLGILAVVIAQIVFGIYMSNEEFPIVASSDVGNRSAGIEAALRDHESAGNSGQPTEEVQIPDSGAADGAGVRENRRATNSQQDIRDRQLTGQKTSRRSALRNLSSGGRVNVQSEYFGRMVVEQSFSLSNRIQNASYKMGRQVFGKMVVDHTSDISSTRSSNASRPKNSYLARSLSAARFPWTASRG